MTDTKITQLRNLMTPLVNYFTMLNSKECSDKAVRMIEHDKKQSIINLPKIREILAQIPDEACEGKTSGDASALPIPDVSKSCENCKFNDECRHKQFMPEGQKMCKFYIEHVC